MLKEYKEFIMDAIAEARRIKTATDEEIDTLEARLLELKKISSKADDRITRLEAEAQRQNKPERPERPDDPN